MKIWKYPLEKARTQLVRMPSKSEIMDIQMQNGELTLWVMADPETETIEVRINTYGTGYETNEKSFKDVYLATIQNGEYVWHFFMNYEK